MSICQQAKASRKKARKDPRYGKARMGWLVATAKKQREERRREKARKQGRSTGYRRKKK